MYMGSIESGRILRAFELHVPGCYVRDYRGNGGYITICRDFKTIKWGGQTTTTRVERQVPARTLCSLPTGNVTAATQYAGLKLHRPGWRQELRRASRYLSDAQKRAITRELNVGEVFYGIR